MQDFKEILGICPGEVTILKGWLASHTIELAHEIAKSAMGRQTHFCRWDSGDPQRVLILSMGKPEIPCEWSKVVDYREAAKVLEERGDEFDLIIVLPLFVDLDRTSPPQVFKILLNTWSKRAAVMPCVPSHWFKRTNFRHEVRVYNCSGMTFAMIPVKRQWIRGRKMKALHPLQSFSRTFGVKWQGQCGTVKTFSPLLKRIERGESFERVTREASLSQKDCLDFAEFVDFCTKG